MFLSSSWLAFSTILTESLHASLTKWDATGFYKVCLSPSRWNQVAGSPSTITGPTSRWMEIEGRRIEQRRKHLGCSLLQGLERLRHCRVISSGIFPSGSWEILSFHTEDITQWAETCVKWDGVFDLGRRNSFYCYTAMLYLFDCVGKWTISQKWSLQIPEVFPLQLWNYL